MRNVKGLVGTIVLLAPVVAVAQTPPANQPANPPPPTQFPPPPTQFPPPAQPGQPQAVHPEPAAAQPVVAPTMPAVVDESNTTEADRYARQGVREIGAAAGLALAQDIRAVNFSPSIGWFLMDSFQLSAILDVTNLKAGAASATMWSALAEPSFHFMVNQSVFGFFGLGIGAAWVNQLGTAMAVAPHLGLDVMVGKTGILRPSLSYEYTTHDAMGTVNAQGETDVTLVAISNALRFNIGYSRMW
jgi:hypothetical protein